jgi:hypothetical protein
MASQAAAVQRQGGVWTRKKADGVGPQLLGLLLLAHQVAQGEPGPDDHLEGQGLQPDRQTQPGGQAGQGGAPGASDRGAGQGQHAQGDLDVVVVHPAGAELQEHRHVDGQHDGADEHRRGPAHPPRHGEPCEHHRRDPQQGPEEAGGELGPGGGCEQAEEAVERRQPPVDQPRPVHIDAHRRLQPGDLLVEPALAGGQGPHHHHPHGVVGVAQGERQVGGVGDRHADGGHDPHRQGDQEHASPGAEIRRAGKLHQEVFRPSRRACNRLPVATIKLMTTMADRGLRALKLFRRGSTSSSADGPL